MFVSTESLGVIQDNIYFKDKELPKGINAERFVSQFLELSVNPTGDSAYKRFSTMTEGNTFVTSDVRHIDVTPLHTLQSLALQLGIPNSNFIKIYLKDNRVTASCRLHGRTYGARGINVSDAFFNLLKAIRETPVYLE